MISDSKPLFSEPKVLVTGVEGAGKTLLAVQQAALLTGEVAGAEIYQLNIKGADPIALPKLPFPIDTMAVNDDGSPLRDENGSAVPMWATLPNGSVIIVDECHKVFPQRGPGRPPAWVEAMAEGRQHGIRFVLLTQTPAGVDLFLRERIHRHYHLERKGNLQGATVFEFDHCVDFPRKAYREKKDAVKHLWRYPKKYFGWYKSAESHHFKLRIPLKIWLALFLVPVIGFIGYRVVHQVGNVVEGKSAMAAPGDAGSPRAGQGDVAALSGELVPIPTRAQVSAWLASWQYQQQPRIPGQPWTAPIFDGRPVTADDPRQLCVAVGRDGSEGCHCYSEQATPIPADLDVCLLNAKHGEPYNPFRRPSLAREAFVDQDESGGPKPVEPRDAAEGVAAAIPVPVGAPAGPGAAPAAYGGFRAQ